MDVTELRNTLVSKGIRKVKLGGFDVDGVLRGKYVSVDKFDSILDGGLGFCDVIFGWDIADVLYDNAKVTGWHSGYPDAHARVDVSTMRILPWEPDTASFLIDFVSEDGKAHPACPRSLLKRVIARAASMGITPVFAAEYEFFLFRETPASLHEKGFRNLTPLSPGMFGYSWVRSSQNKDVSHAILDQMRAFEIPIESFHTETGPGVYEVAIRYDDALRTADNAALFKAAMKVVGPEHGVMPSFMAKWSADLPGCGGHLHQSMWVKDGTKKRNAFHDESAPDKASKLARQYIAGQLAMMPAFTALFSPTINSYKRYVPGVWAPLTASWGVENRTATIRWIPGGPSSTRLEYRQTAADMNPYIAIAACIAAGLYGIEKGFEAPEPAQGSAEGGDYVALPRTLKEANQLLEKSAKARALLGEEFVDHYVRSRDWEVRQYEKSVSEWELRRYFEAV
jgi:glutamine synthetase